MIAIKEAGLNLQVNATHSIRTYINLASESGLEIERVVPYHINYELSVSIIYTVTLYLALEPVSIAFLPYKFTHP